MVYFKLCEEGYASSIREAEKMSVREVLQALNRVKFRSDWEGAFQELNKPKGS